MIYVLIYMLIGLAFAGIVELINPENNIDWLWTVIMVVGWFPLAIWGLIEGLYNRIRK